MEDTLVVPKIPFEPIRRTRERRPTTQFAPEPRRAIWPWLLGAALLIAALARPIDPTRTVQLSTQASEVLRALPGQ